MAKRFSTSFQFRIGSPGDLPTPEDYNGDGRADAAVFRASNNTWYLQKSTMGFAAVEFGIADDEPIPAAFLP